MRTLRGFEPLEFSYVATERIMGIREKRSVMRPLVPVVFTNLGVPYAAMRPLDLVSWPTRRYVVVRPRMRLSYFCIWSSLMASRSSAARS